MERTGANQKINWSALLGSVLLDKKFQCVGDGLQQAVRADAHWAEARLHVGQDLRSTRTM